MLSIPLATTNHGTNRGYHLQIYHAKFQKIHSAPVTDRLPPIYRGSISVTSGAYRSGDGMNPIDLRTYRLLYRSCPTTGFAGIYILFCVNFLNCIKSSKLLNLYGSFIIFSRVMFVPSIYNPFIIPMPVSSNTLNRSDMFTTFVGTVSLFNCIYDIILKFKIRLLS